MAKEKAAKKLQKIIAASEPARNHRIDLIKVDGMVSIDFIPIARIHMEGVAPTPMFDDSALARFGFSKVELRSAFEASSASAAGDGRWSL